MPYLVIHLIEPIYLLKQKTKLKENPKQTKTTTKQKQNNISQGCWMVNKLIMIF